MEKKDFVNGMFMLTRSFRTTFTEDELEVWYIRLRKIEKPIFIEVVEKISDEEKYFPTIAKIHEEAKKIIDRNNASEVIEYMNKCGVIENFNKKEQFYFNYTNYIENLAEVMEVKGFTLEDIKKGVFNAYKKFVEESEKNNSGTYSGYSPDFLFRIDTKYNISYFIY